MFANTYHEHLTINKAYLTITGEDKYLTIIDGSGTGRIFNLIGPYQAGHITIECLTIQDCQYGVYSYLQVDSTTVQNCVIHNCAAVGFYNYNGWYNYIDYCEIYDCGGVGVQMAHPGDQNILNKNTYVNTGLYE
ncbi:MAG: right-handed parallel beta-helix repeat-containing protein [Euryarchaeota archaeon]|nr:right-handed parallel beta-helix repeat-containing protein [Euryarchaeota archaeon]